jgi:transcriptional regulator with XRE-family HTH domain
MTVKHSSTLLRELARRLKVVREQRQFTLQEVYDATGIHVGRIESSGINVTLLTLAALCKHYQVGLAAVVADLEHLAEEAMP